MNVLKYNGWVVIFYNKKKLMCVSHDLFAAAFFSVICKANDFVSLKTLKCVYPIKWWPTHYALKI